MTRPESCSTWKMNVVLRSDFTQRMNDRQGESQEVQNQTKVLNQPTSIHDTSAARLQLAEQNVTMDDWLQTLNVFKEEWNNLQKAFDKQEREGSFPSSEDRRHKQSDIIASHGKYIRGWKQLKQDYLNWFPYMRMLHEATSSFLDQTDIKFL